eukprot:4602408-Alexandrium_andersonii.AAC.1
MAQEQWRRPEGLKWTRTLPALMAGTREHGVPMGWVRVFVYLPLSHSSPHSWAAVLHSFSGPVARALGSFPASVTAMPRGGCWCFHTIRDEDRYWGPCVWTWRVRAT